jgi:hypothetical protein
MEGINPCSSSSLGQANNIVQELLEEDLQREIERNAAANKIAMEREKEALAARKRAAESQKMMQEMVNRYESMKKKLDFTKKALEDTNNRIETQERVTAKLDDMKKRLTTYEDRKDALGQMDQMDMDTLLPLPEEDEDKEESQQHEVRQTELKDGISDHAIFVRKLQDKLVMEEEKLKKKAELRLWLEKQVELGEQKAHEQVRIAQEKEDFLKTKEDELQKQKVLQQQQLKEQEEKQIVEQQLIQQEKQLQQQKLKYTGTKPKQRQKSRSNSNSCTPKLTSPEPTIVMTEEQSNQNIQDTVKKIEGKCATVRGNLADMALSEQYLRTKQALLLAKKKEKEMEVAQTMASLREQEVLKMREKVTQMQEMLNNRKLKLKITEDIMEKKDMQTTRIERITENKRQREKIMEKQLVEKKLFE